MIRRPRVPVDPKWQALRTAFEHVAEHSFLGAQKQDHAIIVDRDIQQIIGEVHRRGDEWELRLTNGSVRRFNDEVALIDWLMTPELPPAVPEFPLGRLQM